MRQIRVLGIAPYEGLQNLMINLAALRQEIDLTAYVGDYFLTGLQMLSAEDLSSYDVIISRGGTAEALKAISPIPVISIPLSYYDILNAIKLAQNFHESFAIVGFQDVTSSAKMLRDILTYDLEIYTIHNEDDAIVRINQLQKAGCSMIVGDNMVVNYAKKRGLNAILIASCSDSISAAFDQAVEFCRHYSKIRAENFYCQELLSLQQSIAVVCSPSGNLLYSNIPEEKNHAVISAVRKLVPTVLESGTLQLLRKISGRSFLISAKKQRQGSDTILCFSLTPSAHIDRLRMFGIEAKSCSDISSQFIDSFYSSGSTAVLKQRALSYGSFVSPVMVRGETGTGIDAFAEYIYMNSKNRLGFLYTVDCVFLKQKALDFLMNNPESPFFETGQTFYFKNLSALQPQQMHKLAAFLKNSVLPANHQLLFSAEVDPTREGPDTAAHFWGEQLGCMYLELPTLRERIHDIPGLVSLYLNELNTRMPKQVAGVEPEGISLLQGYTWPQNLSQLRSVLTALTQLTDAPYIRAKDIQEALRQESHRFAAPPSANSTAIDINRPLNDIIHDIIQSLLTQKGMTQEKAAQQLGICRTTLWKYLKR